MTIDEEVRRGAGVYSKPVLRIYDFLVVRLCNSLAWRCPSPLMLVQYNRLTGRRHLDVGPGTGWYLEKARLPEGAHVWLMDLNSNSLESASSGLEGIPHNRLVSNVLDPLPEEVGPFDSIAVNYLFHCVPGSWDEKGAAFGHLADGMVDDGALFGATILGSGVEHNLGGRALMSLYNRLGIFHNRRDDAAGLWSSLEAAFREVDVDVVGTVAVFSARGPRR
jgi:hypothetical protein